MKKLLALLLALLMLTGCVQTSGGSTGKNLEKIAALGTSPEDNYRTWYEIFSIPSAIPTATASATCRA